MNLSQADVPFFTQKMSKKKIFYAENEAGKLVLVRLFVF